MKRLNDIKSFHYLLINPLKTIRIHWDKKIKITQIKLILLIQLEKNTFSQVE